MPFFPSRGDFFAVVFENELGQKERAFEVGQGIAESLRSVHSTQDSEIGRHVFAYTHGNGFQHRGHREHGENQENNH